jgi:Acetyltransferase (GNAT) domain
MKIHQLEEYSIPPKIVTDINGLLQSCFDGYPSHRNYYKSLPTFRLLIWDKKTLVGHLSVVFRYVKIGSTIARIFGISDVCVHPAHRSKKIATSLPFVSDRFSRADCRGSFIIFQTRFSIGFQQRALAPHQRPAINGCDEWPSG